MSKNVGNFEIVMNPGELSKSKAKEFKALNQKKERDKSALFLAEGEKCFKDLYPAFDVENIVCTKGWYERNHDLIKTSEDKVLISDRRGIEIISSFSSLPEVIGVFRKPVKSNFNLKLEKSKFYLLLDEVQDPGNLGTIIRTCDWFGVYDIFASPNTVDVYSPKVVQSTMGSLSRVKVHYLDLKEVINEKKEIPLLGTLLNGVPVNEYHPESGALIIMGNEGRGISEELKSMIDVPLTIPPVNKEAHPDSLNVAIATAIILNSLIS